MFVHSSTQTIYICYHIDIYLKHVVLALSWGVRELNACKNTSHTVLRHCMSIYTLLVLLLHRESENEIADSVRKFGREIEDLKFSKSTLERQRETLEGELSASKQEVSGLKGTVAQLTSAQAGLNAEFSATKVKTGTLSVSQVGMHRLKKSRKLRCLLLAIVNFWGETTIYSDSH